MDVSSIHQGGLEARDRTTVGDFGPKGEPVQMQPLDGVGEAAKLNFKAPTADAERWREDADARGLTFSEFMREVLADWYAQQDERREAAA